ncbi:2-amino-4-hydroxy-6-hydroxymethyldihydropteridine diphosphokinase [Nitrosomonas eutropha]|uniref:2-amino-4-hydroxy-6-hydroxymethyldihydropteridine pyrophosphokinase n=2 Tax=Nitrosomonas eutropha TaxID=916 RepID=A0ABX5M8U3_9PROT|nr:2-amino-4-hydroxy-6-hydroxymethyldihydropteridine diphosphokinase [Nitrosomonas eutropha]ABI60512.1 2-amino-4-hydroxy-6-hydroxymethyldihydropteridine pyrophosphokinase [Nitrosomonas eutropha C91]PXV79369.1 2-amino-4-hydroxy-6-hydroxymethyldihydropteridine diphosphokinase [Nitrosomonas eutropha]SCX23119.1 2-amino-4-hydroxy-6-hydroxymethyldihydropteridinediphosphokinase [Nitrosomonas eutropha]SEJ11405.1 2-amino-4-hydroxy-6-hydroxymethyldihydropteridinediphosphokinase [Nitrosomonas eutropha]
MTSDFHPESISRIFIALGSNLENPLSQVRRGILLLAELEHSRLVKRSSFYRTAPIGNTDQPDFINAVVQMETNLTPHHLLDTLLEIERACGRVRTFPNAPRILDLDILLFGNLQHSDTKLVLPHPRMHERAFVLQPLLEIAADCVIPGRGPAAACLAACMKQPLEYIASS